MTKSINQIMREAWQKIKDEHGVALEQVDFQTVADRAAGGEEGKHLIGCDVCGSALPDCKHE